jgi:hypothetical protein
MVITLMEKDIIDSVKFVILVVPHVTGNLIIVIPVQMEVIYTTLLVKMKLFLDFI